MLSLSKLPVYAGYRGIGSKPSCLTRGELVHSQTPPISLWPASLLPFAVTGTGCQWVKPTLAPLRLVKSSCELSPSFAARDGGLSSTPSLTRCLETVSSIGIHFAVTIPIDGWNSFAKMLFSLFDFQTIDVAVDTTGFLDGGNSSAHPHGATSQFIVGRKNRPI